MAAGIFYLKFRDTRPILEVSLLNPDLSAFDLTGATGWKLHIRLSDGTTKLVRNLTVQGAATLGILRYTWIATDWNVASTPDADSSYTIGGLVLSPTLPLTAGQLEHRMEYEIIGPASARQTFPNDGYDILRIVSDIGQG